MTLDQVKPDLLVRHFHGDLYRIVCLATLEADLSLCVVYRPADGRTGTWVRPAEAGPSPFCGEARPGVPRFTPASNGEDQPA